MTSGSEDHQAQRPSECQSKVMNQSLAEMRGNNSPVEDRKDGLVRKCVSILPGIRIFAYWWGGNDCILFRIVETWYRHHHESQ